MTLVDSHDALRTKWAPATERFAMVAGDTNALQTVLDASLGVGKHQVTRAKSVAITPQITITSKMLQDVPNTDSGVVVSSLSPKPGYDALAHH